MGDSTNERGDWVWGRQEAETPLPYAPITIYCESPLYPVTIHWLPINCSPDLLSTRYLPTHGGSGFLWPPLSWRLPNLYLPAQAESTQPPSPILTMSLITSGIESMSLSAYRGSNHSLYTPFTLGLHSPTTCSLLLQSGATSLIGVKNTPGTESNKPIEKHYCDGVVNFLLRVACQVLPFLCSVANWRRLCTALIEDFTLAGE